MAYADDGIPLASHRNVIKARPSAFQLYQYDRSPLGKRQPLLFIHGLYGEHRVLFRWNRLCKFLKADENFSRNFKIYLARYDSNARLDSLAEECKSAIKALSSKTGQELSIVTLSISGNMVQEAMADPAIDALVDRVLTLGALFHGSPLFCAHTMQYSILHRPGLFLTRLDRFLGYKLYFSRHKNLLHDFCCEKFKEESESRQAGLAAISDRQQEPPQHPHSKFIVYGATLFNGRSTFKKHRLLTLPKAFAFFIGRTIPANLGNNHAVLRILNQEMTLLVNKPASRESDSAEPASAAAKPSAPRQCAYQYNDGITPITSALCLKGTLPLCSTPLSSADLEGLSNSTLAGKARLFIGLDHVSFLDGKPRFSHSRKISDQLSPAEKPREIFAWVLTDLLAERSLLESSRPAYTGSNKTRSP